MCIRDRYNSSRWASDTVELDGFTTLNLKAAFKPSDGTVLEAGVTNVADKDYELARAYRTGGRNVQVTLRWATP